LALPFLTRRCTASKISLILYAEIGAWVKQAGQGGDVLGDAPCSLLNPRTPFAANWHVELIAAKLAAVRQGHIRRLIGSLPPRHLKSHLA
jgi:hypothetical protein